MGFYIKVNHSKFESTAKAIENYVSKHKNKMEAAGSEVTKLSKTWQGKDSIEFQNKWDTLNDNDSTSHKMTEALENYAQGLRYAASLYKDAQSKAVNRANWL